MKFYIKECANGRYVVYSVVKTNFGGDAKNFVGESATLCGAQNILNKTKKALGLS